MLQFYNHIKNCKDEFLDVAVCLKPSDNARYDMLGWGCVMNFLLRVFIKMQG